jgi:hypothetical protein
VQGDEDGVRGRGGEAGQQLGVGVAQLGLHAGAGQLLGHLGAGGEADLPLDVQPTGQDDGAQRCRASLGRGCGLGHFGSSLALVASRRRCCVSR